MNKKEIFSLTKQVSLVGVTCLCLFFYIILLSGIKNFGLPQGATILIQIAIVFAIIFTVILAIFGNIYESQKIKEEQDEE